jgi:hypothetical protein
MGVPSRCPQRSRGLLGAWLCRLGWLGKQLGAHDLSTFHTFSISCGKSEWHQSTAYLCMKLFLLHTNGAPEHLVGLFCFRVEHVR